MDHHCFGSGNYCADHCSTGAMLQTSSACYYKPRLWTNHQRLWLNIQHLQELKLCGRQIMIMVAFFVCLVYLSLSFMPRTGAPIKNLYFYHVFMVDIRNNLASVDVFRAFQHRALTFFLSLQLYAYSIFLIQQEL